MPDRFLIAQKISALATELDDINKIMLLPHEQRQITLFIETAHATAKEFAGNQVHILYNEEELSAEDLAEIKRAAAIAVHHRTQADGLPEYIRKPSQWVNPTHQLTGETA